MRKRTLSGGGKQKNPQQRQQKKSMKTNQHLLAIKKYTSSLKRQDKKTLDTQFSGAYNNVYTSDTVPSQQLNFNSAPSFQSVNLIQTGVAQSMRIGNKVSLKSLKINCWLDYSGNGQVTSNLFRLMVVYDRQPNGTYPTAGDLFNHLDQTGNLTNPTLSNLVTAQINPNYFDRFVVLLDKNFESPWTAAGGDNTITSDPLNEPWIIKHYINLRGLETTFKSTANPQTVAGFSTGNLMVIGLGEDIASKTGWRIS